MEITAKPVNQSEAPAPEKAGSPSPCGVFSGLCVAARDCDVLPTPGFATSLPFCSQTPLASLRAEGNDRGCFPPDAVQERIDYLNTHPAAADEKALINDQEIINAIGQISETSTRDERTALLGMVLKLVHKKHLDAYTKSLPILRSMSGIDYFAKIEKVIADLHFILTNGDELCTRKEELSTVGGLDALFSILIDISSLLKGEIFSDAVTLERYSRLMLDSGSGIMITGDAEFRHTNPGKRNEKQYFFSQRVAYLMENKGEHPGPGDVVHTLFKKLMEIKVDRLKIFANISDTSAGHLKTYLHDVGINRLFLPMAGSGYFAAQLLAANITSTCFDISPPEKTYTKVFRQDAFQAVETFSKMLTRSHEDISGAAMMIDAPPPQCTIDRRDDQMLSTFLARLIQKWFECGGKYTVIIAEAALASEVINTGRLKKTGIQLMPLEPGFSADIYRGLGGFIGVCGVYEITPIKSKKAKARHKR